MKCCICKETIKPNAVGWDRGNNALPVINGRCCDDCNNRIVIPLRINLHFAFQKQREEILKTHGIDKIIKKHGIKEK